MEKFYICVLVVTIAFIASVAAYTFNYTCNFSGNEAENFIDDNSAELVHFVLRTTSVEDNLKIFKSFIDKCVQIDETTQSYGFHSIMQNNPSFCTVSVNPLTIPCHITSDLPGTNTEVMINDKFQTTLKRHICEYIKKGGYEDARRFLRRCSKLIHENGIERTKFNDLNVLNKFVFGINPDDDDIHA
uniref:Uncharacterized protein n=1 Tax=Tetranychus urticae TaxID=32264 RepID=T1JT15_TETUR